MENLATKLGIKLPRRHPKLDMQLQQPQQRVEKLRTTVAAAMSHSKQTQEVGCSMMRGRIKGTDT